MYLTLHLDNKRFLCLFVKFVLYRGPVLCEKHRISFFLFFPPPSLHSIVNLFLVCPVRTKTFSTHVASKMVHVVRKTGLSTHAGNAPRSPQRDPLSPATCGTRPRQVFGSYINRESGRGHALFFGNVDFQ